MRFMCLEWKIASWAYDNKGERVLHEGMPFPKLDIVIPRVRILNNVELRLAIVKQFEMMKMPILNGYMPVSRAKNKLRTMQILHSLGIPTPRTVAIHHPSALKGAIEAVGGNTRYSEGPLWNLWNRRCDCRKSKSG